MNKIRKCQYFYKNETIPSQEYYVDHEGYQIGKSIIRHTSLRSMQECYMFKNFCFGIYKICMNNNIIVISQHKKSRKNGLDIELNITWKI